MARARKPVELKEIKSGHKDQKRHILIVCCGEKTEPNYFKRLCSQYKRAGVEVEVIQSDKDGLPLNVVNTAITRSTTITRSTDYDDIYCVFDRDEFHEQNQNFQKALKAIEKFNNKKEKQKRSQAVLHNGMSTPCFEYWLLLHFVDCRTSFIRTGKKSPADRVITELKKYLPSYAKGDCRAFEICMDEDKINAAITRAKCIFEQHEKDEVLLGECNPITLVYEVVEALRK